MPEEKPLIIDPILTQLSRLDEKLDAFRVQVETRFNALEQRISKMEGGFEQMDRRLTNVEALQRWVIGIMITSWLTLVGLAVTILSKLL